jgi:hypothetical protein
VPKCTDVNCTAKHNYVCFGCGDVSTCVHGIAAHLSACPADTPTDIVPVAKSFSGIRIFKPEWQPLKGRIVERMIRSDSNARKNAVV